MCKQAPFKLILYLILSLMISTSYTTVLAADDNLKEYGIVILPDSKCTRVARNLNKEIEQKLGDLKNVKNHWHVTLYHGAYKKKDLKELHDKLQTLNPKSFNIIFNKIYSTQDRWIDWGVEKNAVLEQLHEDVVKLASPYSQRPLKRASDVYNKLPEDKQKQVDKYGVSGVLELYNPHMTLFYQYPPNDRLHNAAETVKDSVESNTVCVASKMVLGVLGYNGNIKKILYSIDMR